ncbi:dihydropteroate synthase [Candidatus Phycorickettsia trachydisci]|uniref:Dihydropteroate synthase n=1 Tax=Candidatus Phycorickettsia trachydisci TaxID=2115978 RepID=A0A2P1P9X3_9RICK|nr:dihydropteroate synthase [Candidatus Phycorickettsia trachydisci]AVP88071.1 dihydropteroate synthase [Candidatus Phycorickettsia trachydisci]
MKPKIWGIINITPDSFSDGGKYFSLENALRHAQDLIDSGADVIDIGGESTRPGANVLGFEEEWSRIKDILPLIKEIKKDVIISLDTTKGEIIKRAINYIDIINDVSGFSDPIMLDIVKNSGLPAVLIHNLGVPADPSKTIPEGLNVIEEVSMWFEKKLESLSSSNLILDPGIGFGKTASQSLEILKNIAELHKFNLPLLVGHSRKSYMKLLGIDDKDAATGVISLYVAQKQVQHIRVHNVALNKQFLDIYNTLL